MKLNIIDSIYFSVITMATVGYGDISPITPLQKIFAISLAVIGIGIVAYALTSILTNISNTLNKISKGASIMKKIEKMEDYYVICGYGRVGKAVLNNLIEREHNVVIIEKNEEIIEKINTDDDKIAVLKKDGTDSDVLKAVLTEKCNSIMVTTGSDVVNLFIVLSIREIDENVLIVSRLNYMENKHKLEQAGANKIISPEVKGAEDIFYNAINNHLIKITVKNNAEEVFKRMNIVKKYNCRLESIEYHFPGIRTALPIKITNFNSDITKEIEHIRISEEYQQLIKLSKNHHSEWISCPNKKTLNVLIEEIKKECPIIGINLTNEEIYEIIKKEN